MNAREDPQPTGFRFAAWFACSACCLLSWLPLAAQPIQPEVWVVNELSKDISILDDLGNVQVAGVDSAKVHACIEAIRGMCETPKIGTRYTGTVKSIKEFGAFIEILPGVEGLCHISELGDGYVNKVTDIVNMGDEIEVEVINVDDRGKVKLSRRAVLQPAGGERD